MVPVDPAPCLAKVRLGDALLGAVGVVAVVAVDHQHCVGVLFDSSLLAQVTQLGPFFLAGFESRVEAGHSDDGHVEFAGRGSEVAADLGDFC